jgi:hypothetical protein
MIHNEQHKSVAAKTWTRLFKHELQQSPDHGSHKSDSTKIKITYMRTISISKWWGMYGNHFLMWFITSPGLVPSHAIWRWIFLQNFRTFFIPC